MLHIINKRYYTKELNELKNVSIVKTYKKPVQVKILKSNNNKSSGYKKIEGVIKAITLFEVKSKIKKVLEIINLDKSNNYIKVEQIKNNEVATDIVNNGEIYFEFDNENIENFIDLINNEEITENFVEDDYVVSVLKVQNAIKATHVICSIEDQKIQKKLEANFKTEGKILITIEQDINSGKFFSLEHDIDSPVTYFKIVDMFEPKNEYNKKKIKLKYNDIDMTKNNIFKKCKNKLGGGTQSDAKEFLKKDGKVIIFKVPFDN